MPNWCYNDLDVSGDANELSAFVEYAKGRDTEGEPTPLDFGRFTPPENWGTKWNACEAEVDEGDLEYDVVRFRFDTAWSPPKPVILAASQRFPALTFSLEYSEPNMGLYGRYTCEGGVAVEDLSTEDSVARGG